MVEESKFKKIGLIVVVFVVIAMLVASPYYVKDDEEREYFFYDYPFVKIEVNITTNSTDYYEVFLPVPAYENKSHIKEYINLTNVAGNASIHMTQADPILELSGDVNFSEPMEFLKIRSNENINLVYHKNLTGTSPDNWTYFEYLTSGYLGVNSTANTNITINYQVLFKWVNQWGYFDVENYYPKNKWIFLDDFQIMIAG